MIREKQNDGILGEIPLLMVDNDIIFDPYPEKVKKIKIKKSKIRSVEIIDMNKSVKMLGARGKYGFIHIFTKGRRKSLL